jgi:hypothetical protein
MLIDVTAGTAGQVAGTLRGKPGVMLADEMDEQSKVMAVVEAVDQYRLAELSIGALESVEETIDGIQFFTTKGAAQRGKQPKGLP